MEDKTKSQKYYDMLLLMKELELIDYILEIEKLTKIDKLEDLEFCLLKFKEKKNDAELISKIKFQIEEWISDRKKEEFDKKDIELIVEQFEKLKPGGFARADEYSRRALLLPNHNDSLKILLLLLKRYDKVSKQKLSDSDKIGIREKIEEEIEDYFISSESQVDKATLKKSLESSADANSRFFISYISVFIFLIVTVSSITDKMILLNSPLKLPLLAIDIPLSGFFLFTPLVVIALHFNMLFNFSQHLLKLRQYFQMNRSSRKTEELMTHPFLLNYLEIESVGAVVHFFLKALNWIVLFAIPLAQLMWIQLIFSKYQDSAILSWHLTCIFFDLAILFLFWRTIREEDLNEKKKSILKYIFLFGIYLFIITIVSVSMLNAYYVFKITGLSDNVPELSEYSFHDSKMIFPRLQIEKQEIKDVNLNDRNLIYAKFYKVKFTNVDFSYSNLKGANFILCEKEKTNFYKASMDGIRQQEYIPLREENIDAGVKK